ncbi:hypothetical protein BAE44_0011858 [Dichanthelium oligosanthes]|uniref:Retrovirus-related Pol polyprotein from transposon TNT 1-94-like beta-barrel domain-containing protein n=1 Tax=Dichanthelium oligosanthes TaxID=888268 RepID=A0A1E5VPQ8_9POAL|nr:hypothetical protein BAE44_0011858 [Dichanthelium oligosanthes]
MASPPPRPSSSSYSFLEGLLSALLQLLDNPSPDGQPQHSHECILELNKELRPSPVVILDSGASCHVAGDGSLFSSPATTITQEGSAAAAAYQACDGRRLAVAGVGTICFKDFHLPNVLYVPDLRTLVIRVSVQQLAEELDYLVMFGGGQCHVKDRTSGKIVGKGRLHDDDALYHLEFLKIPPDTADADPVPQDPV